MSHNKLIEYSEIEEFEQQISNLFDEKISGNKYKYINRFDKEIKMLNRLLAQYFYLSQSLKELDKADKTYRRFLLGKGYLETITNNFFTIKDLFVSGLPIQFQLILRSQIELISNLAAFIGDDDYFIRYGTDSFTSDDGYITPKTNHAIKTLKKVIGDSHGVDSKEYVDIFIGLLDKLYSELSATTHGKFVNIMLQAMGELEGEELEYGLFGVDMPIGNTKSLLSHSSLLFQLFFFLIKNQLEKKELLNNSSEYYDIINSYKRIDLLNYEGLYK